MRMLKKCRNVILFLGLILLGVSPEMMAFGKNKVTYTEFDWKVHSTEHFDFYYYPDSLDLMPDVVTMFQTAYVRMSESLGTDLSGKIPVILYRTYTDFQQTNTTAGFIPGGVAGFSEPIKRRIVIPLQNSRRDLEELINHELVHSFQFEILFQNRLNRISPVPLWIMEGTAEHLAADWDPVGRMVLRDAVINNYLPSLEYLNSFNFLPSQYLGYKISQSAIDYMRDEYGIPKLRALLYEMRKTLRTRDYFRKAVEEIYGIPLADISARWQDDLRRRIIEIERRRESIVEFEKVVSRERGYYRRLSPVFGLGDEVVHFFEATPDGLQLYTGSVKGKDQKKLKECLTCDLSLQKYRRIVTDGRPLSAALNDGRLVYISHYEKDDYLQIIDPVVGGLTQTMKIAQDAPESPAFSPDGNYVAYTAWQDTQCDIFIMNTTDGSTRQLTDDLYFDQTPFWSPDGNHIVYSAEHDGQFDLYLVEVATGKTQLLLTSPGDELTPAWSPDGRSIVYISDRLDGILDPYILDLETLEVTRLAAPVTGCMVPSFSHDSKEVIMIYYYQGSERIVIVPATRSPSIPEVGADVEPLGIDGEMGYAEMAAAEIPEDSPKTIEEISAEPVKFKLIPDYAVGLISYGTDNELLVEGGVVISDVLGDHQIELLGRRRDERTGFLARYMYLKNRTDYGAIFSMDSDYFYVFDSRFARFEKIEWEEYWLIAHAEYPISTFYRVELNAGYERLSYDSANLPQYDSLKREIFYVEPAIAGDTVKYKLLTGYPEAHSGWRFRINTRIPVSFSDDFEDYWNTYADFREYIPLGQRSLIALRQWGAWSEGDDPRYFGVGGVGTLRGYDYNRFVGSRVAMASCELRFPLLDRLEFPGNIGFYGFRGKLFVDAAAIWNEGDDSDWEFDDPDTDEREGRMYASFGWGINFWLIGVEWHFEWARQTNFSSTNNDWYYEWSIRRSF